MALANANTIAGGQNNEFTKRPDGKLTQVIERQATRIPSLGFLGLAIGAMAISAGLEVFSRRRRDPANFVGLWVPTILLLGIYNKLAKQDATGRNSSPASLSYR